MKRSTGNSRRQGVALIMALALMAVLTTILSVVTLQAVAQARYLVARERLLQADWLARAGVEFAAARLLESDVAFTDEKQQLVADSKLRVIVEKAGPDVYKVTAEATVGSDDEKPVARTAQAHFRRLEKDGAIRLQNIPGQ